MCMPSIRHLARSMIPWLNLGDDTEPGSPEDVHGICGRANLFTRACPISVVIFIEGSGMARPAYAAFNTHGSKTSPDLSLVSPSTTGVAII
eukprot:CAMPEP_0115401234 /NCGR_PEP_ID=MMETSP0271-20121206/15776_1 /TAXON_ID=71861 /ORGANISM="Scrippsiella trochoidea, Strain CCMP3099" /LENGTH=90 /DNA_ID=CAMNT_0002825129 /DNA_START=407 /DNA_END=679 /DNA_ORIENTATION=+